MDHRLGTVAAGLLEPKVAVPKKRTRDKTRNARRDMTKWEADWLLGATASQGGVDAVVALGVKDADAREKLAWYEQEINRHRSKPAPTTPPPATGKSELR